MIKDRAQKAKAVRYCVATGILPFPEAVVTYVADTGPRYHTITDVDVLGVRPADSEPLRRVIFDCKTLKSSPINRAIWARGLCEFVQATDAFVILSLPAPESHRLAASSIGVRLFHEPIFDHFAAAASTDYALKNSYIEDLALWDELATLNKRFPPLEPLLLVLRSSGPLSLDPAHGIRSLLGSFRKVEGELDPNRNEHVCIVLVTAVLLLLHLSELVRVFNPVFDPTVQKEHFETTLRHYIWGGRENFDVRQRLQNALLRQKGGQEGPSVDLPAWNRFLELFRSLLDSPTLVGSCCIPGLDLALRSIATREPDLDGRLARRLQENRRICQYLLMTVGYLCEAARVPKEFKSKVASEITQVTTQPLSGEAAKAADSAPPAEPPPAI